MDKYNNIIEKINKEFDTVSVIKKSEKGSVSIVREKKTGKRFVFRKFSGKSDVYKEMMSVSCKNLPKIKAVQEFSASTFVLEEYIYGDTLFDILKSDVLSEKETVDVAVQICDALEVIHGIGAVHRDIKPENIILHGSEAVLIDFDASRIVDPDKSTDTRILGTMGYAAPEQYGLSQTDARSDIYSLGVVLNVMLTGEHPSTKLAEGKIGDIVQKCTMINPEMRYQTAREVKDGLLEIGFSSEKRKNRLFLSFAVIAAAIILSVFGLYINNENGATEKEIIASGFCGDEGDGTNLEWKIDSDYILTIRGKGRMANYNLYDEENEVLYPWYDYKEKLFGLVIEEGVTSIGTDAFREMKISCEMPDFPKSLTEIGTMAFCCNDFFGNIILPENLKILGDNAFQEAGEFSYAYIPSAVIKIYDSPFRFCEMDEIIVAEDNPFYCSIDGALFNKEATKIIQFPINVTGKYTLPESVEVIGNAAFEQISLSEITINENIKSVNGVAFHSYNGKVVFNGKVEEIKSGAFRNEQGITDVYFMSGAPQKVERNIVETWHSFIGNINIYYLEGTPGWEFDSDGLWNGYEVIPYREDEFVEYIELDDIGDAQGRSIEHVPDFYDFWSAEEIITKNIKIAAPGNLENYLNWKFSGDILTLTFGKIPEEEWKKALRDIPEEDNMIYISIILEAPDKSVNGIFAHNGNGPTYSNLKKQEQNGKTIEYSNFNPLMDYDWTSQEMALVIREDGKISVAPIQRESVFFKVIYWRTVTGEVIRQILPYQIKFDEDFLAWSFEDETSVKSNDNSFSGTEWMDYYWEPVSDPERVVFRTIHNGKREIDFSEAESYGLASEVLKTPGFVKVFVKDKEKFSPELVSNMEVFLLPPDAVKRENGESIESWIERVYSETKYAGYKLTAGGVGPVENAAETAEFQNSIVNAGYFYYISDRNTCCSNAFAMNSAPSENGTFYYTIDYQYTTFMLIDWYLENPETNPNARPERREYLCNSYESFTFIENA